MSRSFNRYAPGPDGTVRFRRDHTATGMEPAALPGPRVASAAERSPDHGAAPAPVTITLCDGSQFTFSRLADLRVTADA